MSSSGRWPTRWPRPGLRRQIVQALATALQHPASRRPVWVSAEQTDGTLDQDLYAALLGVAGF